MKYNLPNDYLVIKEYDKLYFKKIIDQITSYDIELNDEIWVMENIKSTFSYVDSYNITLVLPILK